VLLPILAPISIILLVHAWAIPELYAARGARAVRPRSAAPARLEDRAPEQVAAGFLADLVDHRPRELLERTGLVLERGSLGVWLLGQAGALLVRPGGRRVKCYCVKVTDSSLPASDRIAHLLLALRTDEIGFATLANLSFSGARWRVRRRLPAPAREALDVAGREARLGRRGRPQRGAGSGRAAGALRRCLSPGPMCGAARGPIISPMPDQASSPKLAATTDRRDQSSRPAPAPLRRYRISRLRLDSRLQGSESRFEYLKHVYD